LRVPKKKKTSFEKNSQSAELSRNENESEDEKTTTVTTATGKRKKLTNHSLQKLDHPNFLPQKFGKINQELYTKFKKDGLRRRLWDAVKQGHCTRCGSTEHLRSKCAQEARGWEVDFNKGAEFWTRTAGKLAINGKQARLVHRARPKQTASRSVTPTDITQALRGGNHWMTLHCPKHA
jgi:hypothetical protein